MKHGPNVWVIRRRGRFTIKEEGCRKALISLTTQRTAIVAGRVLAQANKSELFIQNQKGRIRAKDSHGFDKNPPRG